MKILVADDSELSRKLIKLSLNDDYKVTYAEDGNDALEKIKEETPDLIILDVMMPFITGLELLSWIKENYEDQIKIIMLTSLGAEDVVLEAFSLGADDFVTKPFDPKDLSLRIRRFEQE